MKLYKVIADKSEIVAVSLVNEPAIDLNFIHLHKEKPQFICFEQDEKHLLVGCVLRPDYPIYRNNGKEEYYLEFPKETVERLAYDYMQSGRIYSFTTDHKDNTDNVSIVESWIKTSENDKSNDYGLDVPIGSWMICAKVEDELIWERVKTGELNGFSVESFVNLEEIMMNKQENIMAKENLEMVEVNESFWTKIAEIIKNALKNPEVTESEAEVESAQVVEEIKEEANVVEDEVVVEEMVEDEVVVEETKVEPEVIAEEVVTEVVTEAPTQEEAKDDLQVVIDELNKRIDELNAKISELEMENQKLSKQPSAKPVNVKGLLGSDNKFDRMLSIMNGSAFK